MPFAAKYLLELGWDRWEVEVVRRECKSSLGLGEIQCWSKAGAILAVRWQAWSYGVLVLAGYRAWGLYRGPIRPPGRWWNGSGRWSLNTLWRGYRAELWGSEEFRPIFTPTTDGGGPNRRSYWRVCPTPWRVRCADSDSSAQYSELQSEFEPVFTSRQRHSLSLNCQTPEREGAPPSLPLFTEVRGTRILGSSLSPSCIVRARRTGLDALPPVRCILVNTTSSGAG
jgi:hypothetical protein